MAGDVAKKVNENRIGIEGAAYIAPNGLKIVPSTRQKVVAENPYTPISDTALSGQYVDRFDDKSYYNV